MKKNCIIVNIMSEFSERSNRDKFTEIVGKEDGSLGTIDIYVPEQCMSCPRIIEALNNLDEYRKTVNRLLAMALGGDKVALVDEATGETLDEDKATKIVCKMTARGLDELDAKVAETQRGIYVLASGCTGPLGLQVSDGEKRVSVHMCDSPGVFYSGLGESQIGEAVIIERELEE
jgi:hypothetical protein